MVRKILFLLLTVFVFFLLVNTGCKKSTAVDPPGQGYEDPLLPLKTLTVTSSAFGHGDKIPAKYTCEGENISPPLHWDKIPQGTKSFAVVFEDRSWRFIHMVLFDLPPDITDLPEDIKQNLPAGAQFGKTDSKIKGYFGPCPNPGDSNDYYFYVYALDTVLNLSPDTDSSQLMANMSGHILAWGELLGIYR